MSGSDGRGRRRRQRGAITRLTESGLAEQFGLDALGLVGLVLIGVGLRQLHPTLLWMYAGVLCLVFSIAIARTRSRKPTPSVKEE